MPTPPLPRHSESKRERWKWAVRILWGIPALSAFLFTFLVLRKPHQVSERFLRLGGGIIKSATQNVEKIALFGGGIVLLFWIGIAVVAVREKNRSSENERI